MLLFLRILLGLGIFGLLTSTVFMGLVFAGVRRFRHDARAQRRAAGFQPPVSLLKPLHGAEPGLAAHLESFFTQDYPAYEILFCARREDDAGLAIARQVASRYPHIPVQFLSTGEATYINAKVSSLERMAAAATSDIFIISDSDVRVSRDYLREVVAPFADKNVGGVTCLYRGAAEQGLWAKLEAVGMSVEMTSGVLVANLLEGMLFMLGPTMAARRESVERMGGFGILGPYCSDDFLLGNEIAKTATVVLSGHVIDHVILNHSFAASMKHQARWMKSTRFSRPKGHFGTALTFAVPFGLLAFAAAAAMQKPLLGTGLLLFSLCARSLMAAVLSSMVLQERHILRTCLLYPLRDLMGFFFWAASYTSSTILWRGKIYRLTEGGLMERIS
ncbi:glycosyltransferase [Acidipila rosea]|uniref:Ceramide glucosyltransferase n=1 Tax=Acidipila rosea TaxID=768535 RepID=A0A4R1L8D2_9BACT|nr:glycosyltransferase [Acidipila rosea]TCK72609.1 ceramide glucosyltransferase [Acidipila rosea]